jgi:hypothetical protein
MTPIKGHTYLLQAAARLSSFLPDLQTFFSSHRGTSTTNCATAEESGLAQQCPLFGACGLNVADMLSLVDLFLVFSLIERRDGQRRSWSEWP